jgi:hypothetical protein
MAQAQSNEPGSLFPIVKNHVVGYIDATGKTVIEPRFADIETKGAWIVVGPAGSEMRMELESPRLDRFADGFPSGSEFLFIPGRSRGIVRVSRCSALPPPVACYSLLSCIPLR